MKNPRVKKAAFSGTVPFSGIAELRGDDAPLAEAIACALPIPFFADGATVTLKKECGERMTYLEESRSLTDEKFRVEADAPGGRAQITVFFSSRRSLRYALLYLQEQALRGEIGCGTAEDYPLFGVRGFIEGFYGTPWSFAERERMIDLMGRKRMNTYYYAPKDDPFHRDRWREQYSGEELEKLKKILGACEEACMDFHYCIAPGLGMRYSSEEDYAALLQKLLSLYAIGVRGFGLLLDDIPETLYYAEDREKFSEETLNAHIFLANRLYDDLKKLDANIRMTVCPMQYHGEGNEYFISKLGRGIAPEISLFWTGHNICSQELTVPEAVRFTDSTLHRPLYWDNFPVNDAEMVNEMHLGCLEGREPGLYRYCRGLISNCMEFAECSAVALMTAADYLWDPEHYDGRDSWKNAVEELAGEDAAALTLFGDNLFFSCLKSENSSIFNSYAAKAEQELFAGNPAGAAQALGEYLERLNACCEVITRSEKKIFRELRPWAEKQEAARQLFAASLAQFTAPSEQKREYALSLLKQYKRIPEVLYDFSFIMTVERMLSI